MVLFSPCFLEFQAFPTHFNTHRLCLLSLVKPPFANAFFRFHSFIPSNPGPPVVCRLPLFFSVSHTRTPRRAPLELLHVGPPFSQGSFFPDHTAPFFSKAIFLPPCYSSVCHGHRSPRRPPPPLGSFASIVLASSLQRVDPDEFPFFRGS